MSVESRRKQREPKTETEKALQAQRAKEGLQGLAIGPVTGLLGLPSDIIDLADMANDAIAKYGKNTTIAQFSKLIKPQLDSVQEKYGRDAFDKGFTELTGIKSDPTRPAQFLGELISIGGAAKAGLKGVKAVGETISDTYQGTKKLFEDSTMPPPDGGLAFETAGAGQLDQTKNLLKNEQKIIPTNIPNNIPADELVNAPTINPTMAGGNTPTGKIQQEKFLDLEKKGDVTPEELFKETGVYRGQDGKLRWEIDDRNANLIKMPKSGDTYSLYKILEFPDLYKEYFKEIDVPGKTLSALRNVKVEFIKNPNKSSRGSYYPSTDTIEINLSQFEEPFIGKNLKEGTLGKREDITSVLLHEVQHAVQRREQFSTGSNISKELEESPNYKKYLEALDRIKKVEKENKIFVEDQILTNLNKDSPFASLTQNEFDDISSTLFPVFDKNYNSDNVLKFLKENTTLSNKQIQNTKNLIDKKRLQVKKDIDFTIKEDAIAQEKYYTKYGEREARLVQERYKRRLKLKAFDLDDSVVKGDMRLETDFIKGEDSNLGQMGGFNKGKDSNLEQMGVNEVAEQTDNLPKLKVDNPGKDFMGREYTDKKIKSALEDRNKAIADGLTETDTATVNIGNFSGQTASFTEPVRLDPKILKDVKGMMGEHKTRNTSRKLELLKKNIKEKGYEENPILVHVREDGVPFVTEGNHRLAEALQSNRKSIAVEIKYLRGAENVEGILNPKTLGLKNKMNKGGDIMKQQMELFEEGGLKDEGNTVDPVSGNEVPPGSTQEEVRDDIPAMLSEGEFVFPADVVRFIGLEKLMTLRQEAKAGLKRMEDMGQMGNSEEATIPDDIPFTMDDLDMEDEAEYNKGGVIKAQTGTFVNQGLGVSQMPSQFANQNLPSANQTTTNFMPPAPSPAPIPIPASGFKPLTTQVTGDNVQGTAPTFQTLIGQNPSQYDELREYVNDAGMTLRIPFKGGQPIYPIPEGYKYVDPEETKTQDVTTQTTQVSQPQQQEEQDDNRPEDRLGNIVVSDPSNTKTGQKTYQIGLGNKGEYNLIDPQTNEVITLTSEEIEKMKNENFDIASIQRGTLLGQGSDRQNPTNSNIFKNVVVNRLEVQGTPAAKTVLDSLFNEKNDKGDFVNRVELKGLDKLLSGNLLVQAARAIGGYSTKEKVDLLNNNARIEHREITNYLNSLGKNEIIKKYGKEPDVKQIRKDVDDNIRKTYGGFRDDFDKKALERMYGNIREAKQKQQDQKKSEQALNNINSIMKNIRPDYDTSVSDSQMQSDIQTMSSGRTGDAAKADKGYGLLTAKGGLASKKKTKSKRMKQGGLASR